MTRLREEALYALEVTALAAFAFSRPVLDSFGRSPETFVAREASASDVVLFGLVVALAPAVAFIVVGLLSRPIGPGVRRVVHLALVTGLGGVAAWRLGQETLGWDRTSPLLVASSAVVGLALVAARWRLRVAGTFLRVAGVASVVFLAQFLLLSPSSRLVFDGAPPVDDAVAAEVAASLPDEAPPVVALVLDALPTMSLLDGDGRIDAELYPRFAELADTATWYRNHTTVAGFTLDALPAILTGRLPDGGDGGDSPPPESENLFTLLAGSYQVQAREQLTELCPAEVCGVERSGNLVVLLGDAVSLWSTGAARGLGGELLPGALGSDRYEDMSDWIERQDFGLGRQPKLFFYHALLPHGPWEFLPDGSLHSPARGGELPVGFVPEGILGRWLESGTGTAVGRQRHLLQLQATDRLLGRVIDELKAAETFDKALIVVTADHGEAFTPGESGRSLSAGNQAEIAWTPLLVKEPQQTAGEIDDGNALTVDIVPTIAELLGIEVPWPTDGVPLGRLAERDPGVKPFADNENNELRADDGEAYIALDARRGFAEMLAADPVDGRGSDAVWRRTSHGELVGRDVEELGAGAPAGSAVEVERLADIVASAPGGRPVVEVIGHTGVADASVLAYALNGTVAAVTEVEPGERDGMGLAHALLSPEPFVPEHNELTAYLVEGEPGAATLRPLVVRPG